jgi:hypothetical protein
MTSGSRLVNKFHRYGAAIAPAAWARLEAKMAFRQSREAPILVYQMGKVGSTTVFESLREAGLPNPILHVHAISDDVLKYREAHLHAGAGNPYHLDLGEAIGKELERGVAKRCKIISLVRDPIAVEVSGLFEVPQFAPEEVQGPRGLDPAKAAAYLEASLARPGALDYVFGWFDREIKRIFGIDVFAVPFPKERGAETYSGATADLLLLRLEDLDRVGSSAIRDFLALGGPFTLAPANVRADKPEAAAYRALRAHLKLSREACERIYSSRFATHFYTAEETGRFVARWTGR